VSVPTVTSIDIPRGPAGTLVVLTGTGYTTATNVLFGAVDCGPRFNVLSDTQLAVYVPTGSGTVTVTVTNADGTGGTATFAYIASPGGTSAPTVTSLSLSTGTSSDGGDAVTVNGTGYTTTQAVYFGTVLAAWAFVSDTQLSVVSPPGSGPVDVTVVNAYGTSATSGADVFTYPTMAAPTISGVSPSAGYAGTQVTLTGTGLLNVTGCFFGTSPVDVSIVSDTSAIVFTPAGVTGVVDITVVSAGGTSATSSADQFTYVAPNVTPATAITTSPANAWAQVGFSNWQTGSVTVTLTPSGGSGALVTTCMYNNQTPWTYGAPFVISDAGCNVLKFWTVDANGKAEAVNTVYVNIISGSAVPTGLTVTPVGTGQILVSWAPVVNADGAQTAYYKVYSGATTAPATLVASTQGCIVTVPQARSAGAMYFAVSSVNVKNVESAKSATSSAVTAGQIVGV